MVWPLWLKKPGLTNRGVATGVTKFRMAFGGLVIDTELSESIAPKTRNIPSSSPHTTGILNNY